ncbi:MAG: response regulator transcription factor [Roseiflexaceae bacterium]|nr:response regulator transcription factor [Roseiflexaceae bacterium]
MPITLLLVDDHVVVRQGLRMLLAARDDIVIVGEADDGAEAVRRARELQPNVILMDLLLPTMSGIEATRQIRTQQLPCTVIMLTSTVQSTHIQDAIRAGAAGYVLKTTNAQALIDAIHRAARGQRVLDPIAVDALMDGMTRSDALEELTAREHEVLRVLALGRSNAEIATSFSISEATVRSHVTNLLNKLGLRDRIHATLFALKRGIISLDDIG